MSRCGRLSHVESLLDQLRRMDSKMTVGEFMRIVDGATQEAEQTPGERQAA
jgi:hypothetical protein